VQLPIGSEDNFKGMIDLVEMKALVWDSDDKDSQWQTLDVTDDLADKLHITVPSDRAILADIAKYRTELIDTCLEQDDEAMDAYLTITSCPSPDVLRACLRKGTINSAFTPVLCGSSYKNKGVQQVLDAVVDYLPAPTDVAAIKTVNADGEVVGERKCSDDEPFSALAFKVINDAYGALTFVRVYSGVLTKGASVQNSTRGKREKIGRMVEMFAKEPNPIEEARAGDIIALVSLSDTETGDTLCDCGEPGGARAHAFPGPRHQRVGQGEDQGGAGEIRHRARQDGARRSLAASGDRSRDRPDHPARHGRAAPRSDAGSHAHGIRRRRHHGRAPGGLPRDHHQEGERAVRSQEADRRRRTIRGSLDRLRAPARGSGFEFVDETVGGSVPKEYVPSVEKGLKVQKEDGVLAHYPTVDFRATLTDGSYHDVDSNALTFEIAAKAAFREAIRKAGPILLEPVMKVETVTPGDYLGDVIGDINRRRGSILDQLERGPTSPSSRRCRSRRCSATSGICAA
jgi:elongation factor G